MKNQHKPVTIPRPELKSAVRLTAAEMNSIHFGGKHTVLTPDSLKKMGE